MVSVLQESLFDTHDEIMHIIKKHTCVARPSRYLLELILSYMNHVKTYRAFHDDLIDEESYVHFPDAFLNVIERSTLSTQDEYNSALGLNVTGDDTRFIDTMITIDDAPPPSTKSAWKKAISAVRGGQRLPLPKSPKSTSSFSGIEDLVSTMTSNNNSDTSSV
jgi:hypothetical protein